MNTEITGIQLSESIAIKVADVLERGDCTSLGEVPYERIEANLLDEVSQELKVAKEFDGFMSESTSGITFVDVTFPSNWDLNQKTLVGTSIYNLINKVFFEPRPDPRNKLPYTLHKSSAGVEEELKEAGVQFYSPTSKLGYHNDGVINEGHLGIPKYISLMNLYLGYTQPGYFKFADKRNWKDSENFYNAGKNRLFKFRPTAIVYDSELGNSNKNMNREWTWLPVIWRDESGELFVFTNGEMLDPEETDFLSEMDDAISNIPQQKLVKQDVFRVIILRNDIGFHARDIFEGQQVFNGITRLMLRSVSNEKVDIPQQQVTSADAC